MNIVLKNSKYSLRNRIESIKEKGLKALNKERANEYELRALSHFLNLEFLKADKNAPRKELSNKYVVFSNYYYKNKKCIYIAETLKELKAFLISYYKEKEAKKYKKELKKDLEKRELAIKKEKLNEKILKHNQNGLFSPEDLIY